MFPQRGNRLLGFTVAMFVLFFWPSAGHATLYVIVFDKRGISIAADSRHIVFEGEPIKTIDAFEKVIPLGTKLAFMSSGITEISAATSEIRPSQIARRCYADLFKSGHRTSIKDLSASYATSTADQLNGLTDSEKAAVESLMQQLGAPNNQMMESIIAGVDTDGTLRVETIDFYLARPSSAHADILRFEWNLNDAVANEAPRMILSGEINVLRSAFEDAATPIGQLPSFRAWMGAMREGRPINTAETAEALLNLAIEYSPPTQTRLGYPIFVYTLSARGGIKKIRVVPRGEAVNLPH